MPKASGIDFSIINQIRETVSVRMLDGKVVELPLIPLRAASIAETFLQRNDTIAVQYANIQAQLEHKQAVLSSIDKDEALTAEKGFEVVDSAMELVKKMQKRSEELARENHALCGEIHAFIAPYLKDDNLIKQLNDCEDRYTVEILSLMTYGAAALRREDGSEGDTTENPTMEHSQKN
jgi:hypothetical protein